MRFTNSTICFKSETWRGRESMEHDYPICRIFHHRIMDSSSQPSTMYLSWLRLHWTGNYYHEFHPVCIKCGWGEWTPRIKQDKVSLADFCWFTERWSGGTSASHWHVQLRCGWHTKGLPNQICLLIIWWALRLQGSLDMYQWYLTFPTVYGL